MSRRSLEIRLLMCCRSTSSFVSPGPLALSDPGFIPRNTLFAVGIGARYLTPVGPIRVDFAREDVDIAWLRDHLRSAQRVLVLTGAGVSRASGLPTYRGEGKVFL